MKWSIQSFKPYKSPEPDGITPTRIQQAEQLAINRIGATLCGNQHREITQHQGIHTFIAFLDIEAVFKNMLPIAIDP